MIIDLLFTLKTSKYPQFLKEFWTATEQRLKQMNDGRFTKVSIESYWPQVSKFTTENAILHLIKTKETQNLDSKAWVAILAVPSLFTPRDLLTFVDCFAANILHIYLLNDSNTGRYMAVLRLKDIESRQSFVRELNGVRYNSLDNEVCHVVFVNSIQYQMQDGKEGKELSGIELPSCPVCLERLDSSVTGLLTNICLHTFHCTCIAKWGESSCPVCRFSSSKNTSACVKCASSLDCWICLICGNIGCGRYKSGHAREHFLESNHLYALELETQRVWDYAEDCYVHRLLRNTDDGKLVELGMPSASAQLISTSSKVNEASHGDFATLLATQLESQRSYFETLLKKLEKTHDSEISYLLGQIESLALQKQSLALDSEKAGTLKKDFKNVEKKVEKLTNKIQELETELAEERAVSSSLLSDHNTYRSMLDKMGKEVDEKTNEINELKEQVRDLMFYVQIRNQSSQDSELAGASIITENP